MADLRPTPPKLSDARSLKTNRGEDDHLVDWSDRAPGFAGVEQLGAPVDNELQAGEISIHSDLLVHGSEANASSRRRCGLTLRYCPAEVRAELGWNAKGVIVSGSDPSGHWGNPPRPE